MTSFAGFGGAQKVSVFLFGGQPVTASREPREIGYVAEAKEVTLEIFVCGHEDLWELEVVNLCCEVNF